MKKYGFKIVKTFNDSLKNLNEIKRIKIIWIVHIFICFLKIILDLDNLNINLNHIKLFESFISMKTQLRNIKCGFAIGIFATWNKITLLQELIQRVIHFYSPIMK